jgi:hypothetical protein
LFLFRHFHSLQSQQHDQTSTAMTPKAKATKTAKPHGTQTVLDEETPDILPDRTLTAKEAEHDYQKQLALLAEQETEYNGQRSSGSQSAADETNGEEKASL